MESKGLLRCKIVVVGDSKCGKTALLHVFAKDSYPEVSQHLLEIEIRTAALNGATAQVRKVPETTRQCFHVEWDRFKKAWHCGSLWELIDTELNVWPVNIYYNVFVPLSLKNIMEVKTRNCKWMFSLFFLKETLWCSRCVSFHHVRILPGFVLSLI